MTIEQKKILDMALELHEICNAYQIKHYLICGSCLGAIRHKGYIPWDDDIDFVMTREGIEKLMKVFQGNTFPDRVLIGKGIVEGYHEEPYRYISTIDTSIQRSTMHYDCPLGTYVDILVLDPMPKDEKEKEKYLRKMGLYFELSNNVYVTQTQGFRYSPKKYVFCKFVDKILGKDYCLKRLQNYLRKFSEDECDTYAASWQGTFNLSFAKDLFGEMRMVPFEDVMLPVPQKAEEFLRESYGDNWMMEPEPSPAHVIVSDDKIPYHVYYNDYMKHLDKQKWIDLQEKGKIAAIKLLPLKQQVNMSTYKLDGIRIRMGLEKMIADNNLNLDAMLREQRYQEILEIYEEYIERQMKPSKEGFYYWKLFLDMPDELLYPVWFSLIMQGRFYDVNRVLKYRKTQKTDELSGELKELENLIQSVIWGNRALYEENNIDKAYKAVKGYLDRYPDMPELQYINYEYNILKLQNIESAEDIKDQIEEHLKRWSGNVLLRKSLADVQIYLGNKNDAKQNYERVIEETRNGVLRLQCEEQLMKL